jgi:WD40 repeat protein/serine/threonine protein kinase
MDNLVGQTIEGFKFVDSLPSGGMADVYIANEPIGREGNRRVAIKVVKREFLEKSATESLGETRSEYLRRFEREARLIADLRHPHIITLFRYGISSELDQPFIVMPYMDAGTLKDQMEGKSIPVMQILTWLEQIVEALAYVHGKGVVHRDIKPSNILLDGGGNVYVSDFGIAQVLVGQDQTFSISGTRIYAAPEQWTTHEVTPQTDIYSLGVVVFELLTGVQPFYDPVHGIYRDPLSAALPSVVSFLPSADPRLDTVLARATAYQPADRYPNITSFLVALQDILLPNIDGATIVLDQPLLEPNPYQGLQPFTESNQTLFFGREALVQRLVYTLEQNLDERFLAIVGPSGSGKSSLTLAGIVPSLRNRKESPTAWDITVMTPGEQPLLELEAALLRDRANAPASLLEQLEGKDGLTRAIKRLTAAKNQTNFLLIIDQFEELFTLTTDERMRAQFLEILTEAATASRSQIYILTVLRADFYDRPLQHRIFGDLLKHHTEVVLPLSQSELRDAILLPAQAVGAQFDPGLIETIIAEVEGEPGALPLLQVLLAELYDQDSKKGRRLTRVTYDSIGGISKALSNKSETLFQQLAPDEQFAARQLFLRLVAVSDSSKDARRRVKLAEVIHLTSNMNSLISVFDKQRLLTLGNDLVAQSPTVELAHEALIRSWPRFRQWLDDARGDIALRQRFILDAQEWVKHEEDAGLLSTGGRLSQYEDWARTTTFVLSEDEQRFLKASLNRRQELIEQESDRIRREAQLTQRARNRQRFAAALAGFLVVAILLMLLAIDGQRQAQISEGNVLSAQATTVALNDTNEALAIAAVATGERLVIEQQARSNALTARELFAAGESRSSVPLALQAFQDNPNDLIVQQVLFEQSSLPGLFHSFDSGSNALQSAAFSQDGSLVYGAATNGLFAWNTTSGLPTQAWRPTGVDGELDSTIADHELNSDQTRVLVGYAGGRIIIFDTQTSIILNQFDGLTGIVFDVEWSPDENRILAATAEGKVMVWDVSQHDPIATFIHQGPVFAARFTQDGNFVISGAGSVDAETAEIIKWEVATQNVIKQFDPQNEVHSDRVISLDISTDGEILAVSSRDGQLAIWDTVTLSLQCLLGVFNNDRRAILVNFTRDSSSLITVGRDGTIRVWDATQCGLRREINTAQPGINALAISPDGQSVIVSGDANSGGSRRINHWDIINGDWLGSYIVPFGDSIPFTYGIDFSRDGLQIYASTNSDIWVISAQDNRIVRRLSSLGPYPVSLATNIAGNLALEGGVNGTLVLWDIIARRPLHSFDAHSDRITQVAFSNDGQFALSSSLDGSVAVWDLRTSELRHRFTNHESPVSFAAFVGDGAQVISRGGQLGSLEENTDQSSSIVLWESSSGEEIHRLNFGDDTAGIVMGLSDDSMVFAYSREGSIILAETLTFEQHRQWNNPEFFDVLALDFEPRSLNFMTAHVNGALYWWNETSGQGRRISGHQTVPELVAFSPTGLQLITSASGRGESIEVYLWSLAGDAVWVGGVQLGLASSRPYRPDQSTFFAYSDKHPESIVEFNSQTLSERQRLTLPSSLMDLAPQSLVVNTQGSLLAASFPDQSVVIWNLHDSSAVICQQRIGSYLDGSYSVLALSADGSLAASASPFPDSAILIWSTSDCNIEQELADLPGRDFLATLEVTATDNAIRNTWRLVTALTFSDDGQRLYSGGVVNATNRSGVTFSNQLVEWDTQTGELIQRFPVPVQGATSAIALDQSNQRLVLGISVRGFMVWDTASRTPQLELVETSRPITDADISPDGLMAITTSDTGEIALWDVGSGVALRRYQQGTIAIASAVFSPDGRYVLSSDQTTIRRWIANADLMRDWLVENRLTSP